MCGNAGTHTHAIPRWGPLSSLWRHRQCSTTRDHPVCSSQLSSVHPRTFPAGCRSSLFSFVCRDVWWALLRAAGILFPLFAVRNIVDIFSVEIFAADLFRDSPAVESGCALWRHDLSVTSRRCRVFVMWTLQEFIGMLLK